MSAEGLRNEAHEGLGRLTTPQGQLWEDAGDTLPCATSTHTSLTPLDVEVGKEG